MTVTPLDTKANPNWLKASLAPWRKQSMRATALVIADVVPATGFAAGLGWSLGSLVNAVPWDNPADLDWTTALDAAAPGAVLAVSSLIMRGLLSYVSTRMALNASLAAKSGLRQRLIPGLFSGKLTDSQGMTAAVEGIDSIDGHMARFMPARHAAAVSPILLIVAAAIVSPFTALILVFTLLPFVIGMILTGMAAASESRRQFQAMERLSGLFVDRVRAMPAILAFQAEKGQTKLIARASQELALRTSRVLKIAFLSSAILEFFSALAVALVAVYCGFNLLRILPFPAPDTLSLGQAFFLLALAPEVYQPMRRLSAAYHDRQAAEAAVPHLQALEAVTPSGDRICPPLPSSPPSIRFEQVSIAYNEGQPVIDGFNLDIKAGEIIALCGPSGTGKTSILHLLLGLAPLTSGQITLGAEQLGDHTDFSPWIAYAGQAPMVIPGTVADNIALADPAASNKRIMDAAIMAGMSGNLDRYIDERGGGLSGGERRRLGLARAFLKSAPILLLDEPTAHLDSLSDKAILDVIRKAAKGRTTLISTHSETVAALADRIVKL